MSLARVEKADLPEEGERSKPGLVPMSSGVAPMPPGGVFFVTAARQAEAAAELRARRYLIVAAPPSAAGEGRLRGAIDEAVEGALALRGALPPGAPIGADAEATVRDQVLRARALGAAGVAVTFPPLVGAAEAEPRASHPLAHDALAHDALAHDALAHDALAQDGILLGLDDSAVVSAWISAAQRGSVIVLLDERDRDARVLAPRRIAELASAVKAPLSVDRPALRAPKAPVTDSIPPSGEVEKALSEPPPTTVKEGAITRSALALVPPVNPAADAAAGEAADDDPPTQRYQAPSAPRRGVMKKRARPEAPPKPLEAPADIAAAPSSDERPSAQAPSLFESVLPRSALPLGLSLAEPVEVIARGPAEAALVNPASLTSPVSPVSPANEKQGSTGQVEPEIATRRVLHAAEWRAHAVELDKARGPKPVSVIDKLFTSRYMPLVGALARGEVDGSVRAVIDTFRTNFEHSYREAFSALRVTGKRPPMVFDAPEIASRLGRLNGARAVKLLLVDAMRFDIGERVASRLGERLTGRAVCVERSLLWAAIPTSTPTQMNLLARGQEGLREAEPAGEPEAEIVRGRAVGTVRRERIGAREVMKLDLVEARIRASGGAYEERIESIAEEVAQISARYIETLPPRTLLLMFGDHGFRLPAGPDGRTTGPATQGGVSPEEVLVPCHAWLIGGVH